MTAQTTGLNIAIDGRGARTGARDVNRSLESIKQQARRTVSAVGRGFTGLKTHIRGVIGSFLSLKTAILGLGLGLLVRSFVAVASEVELLKVRLNFLFGSIKEGGQAFKNLVKFAATVPFTLREISQSAPLLAVVADGAADLNNLLKITGDIAGATGLTFIETAQNLQKSFAGGIAAADQFRDRGVKAMLGFKEGVAYTAVETEKMIRGIWEKSSNSMVGASAALATTFAGALSMIGDKYFQFQMAVMDTGPFEFLKAAMQVLDDALGKNFDNIKGGARGIGETIVEVAKTVILGSGSVADAIEPAFQLVRESFNGLIDFYNALPEGIKSWGLIGFILVGAKYKVAILAFTGAYSTVAKTINGFIKSINDAFNEFEGRYRAFMGRDYTPHKAPQLPETFGDFNIVDPGTTPKLGRVGEPGKPEGTGQYRTMAEDIVAAIDARRKLNEATAAEAEANEKLSTTIKKVGLDTATLTRLTAAAKKLVTDALTPLEAYTNRLADIKMMKEQNLIVTKQETYAIKEATEAYVEAQDKIEGFAGGARTALRDYAKASQDAFTQTKDVVNRSFKSMEDAIVKMATTGKLEFKGLVSSIVSDIARIYVQRQITGPLADFALSFLPGTGGDSGGGAGGTLTPLAHTGAIVGAPGAVHRSVDPRLFDRAPRFHGGGIVGEEVPTILKRKEGVFTPAQMAALGPSSGGAPINITIINEGGEKLQGSASEGPSSSDGMRHIIVTLSKQLGTDVKQRGPLAQSLESTYGLKRAGQL